MGGTIGLYHHETGPPVTHTAARVLEVDRRPVSGNRNDCTAWELSGDKAAGGQTTAIADGGYRGTSRVIPHRREHGQTELPAWQEEHHASHRTRPGPGK